MGLISGKYKNFRTEKKLEIPNFVKWMNDIVVMILSTCSLEQKIIHLNSNIIHPLNTQVANCFDNPTRTRELFLTTVSQDWKCLTLNGTEFTNNILF